MANSIESTLAADLIELGSALEKIYALADRVEATYFAAGVGGIVTATPNGEGVGDSGIIKSDYIAALTMVQQFKRFADNQPVTQGDYRTTIARLALRHRQLIT